MDLLVASLALDVANDREVDSDGSVLRHKGVILTNRSLYCAGGGSLVGDSLGCVV